MVYSFLFQILDCFVILVVMVLSRFFLKSHFKIVHYIGVVVALTGVSCMIIADVLLGKGGSGEFFDQRIFAYEQLP